jgi:hypothetical protein
MYGPTHDSGYWRIQVGEGVDTAFESPDIVTVMSWAVVTVHGERQCTSYRRANREEREKQEDLD